MYFFRADQFEGEVISSDEGEMHWVRKTELADIPLVDDFDKLLQVMLEEDLNEFQYVVDGDEWKVVLK